MNPLSPLARRVLAFALLLVAITIVIAAGLPDRAAYSGLTSPGQPPIAPEIGAIAPPILAFLPSGEPFDLATLSGSPVVLNFWATWCVPCVYEMPELQAFHEAHPTIPIIGINLGESAAAVDRWMQEGGFTYPTVLDPIGAIASLYALRGQPTTVILSPGGIILNIVFGATTRAALENGLAPYLD